mmetsp:Transcript_780/g.2269  ORF Transcript_780/g.2269 Transcript_780/m.2269 type:complete len:216 (-) Transcript_780:64-711(-)
MTRRAILALLFSVLSGGAKAQCVGTKACYLRDQSECADEQSCAIYEPGCPLGTCLFPDDGCDDPSGANKGMTPQYYKDPEPSSDTIAGCAEAVARDADCLVFGNPPKKIFDYYPTTIFGTATCTCLANTDSSGGGFKWIPEIPNPGNQNTYQLTNLEEPCPTSAPSNQPSGQPSAKPSAKPSDAPTDACKATCARRSLRAPLFGAYTDDCDCSRI